MKNFRDLGISEELETVLNEDRIFEPTDIQSLTIPEILKGRDILGHSETGSGKTFAFVLPILEKIDLDSKKIEALIIAPTRELAKQITEETEKLLEKRQVNVLAAYGGKDVDAQINKLKSGINIVIGTPGRLLDHVKRGSIDLSSLKFLVLDEADEIINMGFLTDVEEIMKKSSSKRQTLLFSATMPKGVKDISRRFMKSPMKYETKKINRTLDNIEELIINTTDENKYKDFKKYLDENNPFMGIIFCRSKERVKELNTRLVQDGYNSDELHGDLSQQKRERALKKFRDLKTQFLVATDIAARGLDIDGITHVFNYDNPEKDVWYIHRIGRTGRQGEEGTAVTFVTPRDIKKKEIKDKKTFKKFKPQSKKSNFPRDKKSKSYNKGRKKKRR